MQQKEKTKIQNLYQPLEMWQHYSIVKPECQIAYRI